MWDAQKNHESGGEDRVPPFEHGHFLDGFGTADRKFHFKADWKQFGGRWQEMPLLPDHLDVTPPDAPGPRQDLQRLVHRLLGRQPNRQVASRVPHPGDI